ncbi:translesion DNA synthesis-associated protein ImuA [Pusillimonas sp. MFBS29]|uniref:translesion DNA synthesis-associated protein ImuA n=1 Tax=Pusillimonas sp. MFBS29 TaxID=2886690 RepID=UPI001D105A54|nr:translesion DNA synthesis-associated protein ImuA [Pusillimonas sp. MFBS29]MCC2597140.1 translesion DNA synthesis-associated protein ImuA [Pusillimonas sp. MFBS29]
MPNDLSSPEHIHQALWRASQLCRSQGRCVDTGFPLLSAELPGGGWPLGNLVEFLVHQPGTGELQLLRPALNHVSQRSVMLVQPPYLPQIAAWSNWGCSPSSLLWVHTRRQADALWAADQVLRSGTFGALLLWQNQIRNQTLRRLQLAAQAGDTLFIVVRPSTAADQSSPSPLRLVLQPNRQGLNLSIVKRRGPSHAGPLALKLYPDTRFFEFDHAIMDRRASIARKPGHALPELAH